LIAKLRDLEEKEATSYKHLIELKWLNAEQIVETIRRIKEWLNKQVDILQKKQMKRLQAEIMIQDHPCQEPQVIMTDAEEELLKTIMESMANQSKSWEVVEEFSLNSLIAIKVQLTDMHKFYRDQLDLLRKETESYFHSDFSQDLQLSLNHKMHFDLSFPALIEVKMFYEGARDCWMDTWLETAEDDIKDFWEYPEVNTVIKSVTGRAHKKSDKTKITKEQWKKIMFKPPRVPQRYFNWKHVQNPNGIIEHICRVSDSYKSTFRTKVLPKLRMLDLQGEPFDFNKNNFGVVGPRLEAALDFGMWSKLDLELFLWQKNLTEKNS
jgi:hypothetical protein